jgi:hypothetical protein
VSWAFFEERLMVPGIFSFVGIAATSVRAVCGLRA